MRILSVAFPFAPVRPECAGGAEQVVLQVHRALRARGLEPRLIACASSAAGPGLVPVPDPGERIDALARALQHAAVRAALARTLAAEPAHVVHLHGVDCASYLPEPAPFPAVVTLHLPVDRYPSALLLRTDVRLCAVSEHQARTLRTRRPVHVLPNGVDLSLFRPRGPASGPVLYLGRLCPEKAPHLAIDAAREAGERIRIAGTVHPYAEHVRYWREEMAPRLGADVELLGAVGGPAKAERSPRRARSCSPADPRRPARSPPWRRSRAACPWWPSRAARSPRSWTTAAPACWWAIRRTSAPRWSGRARSTGAPAVAPPASASRSSARSTRTSRSTGRSSAPRRARLHPGGMLAREGRAALGRSPAPRGAARSLRSLGGPGEGELD